MTKRDATTRRDFIRQVGGGADQHRPRVELEDTGAWGDRRQSMHESDIARPEEALDRWSPGAGEETHRAMMQRPPGRLV